MDELFVQNHDSLNSPTEKETIERIYTQCTNISIDYGIMEKADNVYVIPSNFGWSDLGTGPLHTKIWKRTTWERRAG